MKKILFSVVLSMLLVPSIVLADMGSTGMMGGIFGTSLTWLIYFAIMSLIFSIVFWLTHNWLVKSKR